MSYQNQKRNDNMYLEGFKLCYILLYDESRKLNADSIKKKKKNK